MTGKLCLRVAKSPNSAGYDWSKPARSRKTARTGTSFRAQPKTPSSGSGTTSKRKLKGRRESSWGRLYCRLNLVNVTPAALSVHQIIPCNADWVAEEKIVRAYVESLFSTPDQKETQP